MFTSLFNNPLINSHCLQNELQARQGPSTFQSDQTAPSSSVTSRSLSDRCIINYSFFWATMAFNNILKSPLTHNSRTWTSPFWSVHSVVFSIFTEVLLLASMFSGSLYLLAGVSAHGRSHTVVWTDPTWLVHHSSDVTHLGCLHFLAVMSTAIMAFVWTRFLFPWAYTWSRTARHIWLFLCKLLSCTIYIVTFIGGNRQGMWTHRQNRSKNPDFSTAPH